MPTNSLISDLIFCKYKFYLHLNGKQEVSEYENHIADRIKNISHRYNQILIDRGYNVFNTIRLTSNDKKYFLSNINFKFYELNCSIDYMEVSNSKSNIYISPIFIHPYSNISKEYRIIYQTIAFAYSAYASISINRIKIICGESLISRNIRSNEMIAKTIISNCQKLHETTFKKSLYKKKHCNECGQWKHCKDKLIEKDDLSLLGNITDSEITKYNSKGIFTINQLSYFYKPKRRKKTTNNRRFNYELRALAIREKRTIIETFPDFKEKTCSVYFDFESLPEKSFIYLIGLVVVEKNIKTTYSFWAENKDDEESIFTDFFSKLKCFKNFTCYHYGSFELKELRAFNKRNNSKYDMDISLIENNSLNVLSFFNANIHPPTYTNGLKDIASYFGFKWTITNASGLKSIILREKWEKISDEKLKRQIIQYNIDDCLALEQIIHSLKNFNIDKESSEFINLNKLHNLKYAHNSYNTEYFKNIAKYAYFDYQRSKVFLKTNRTINKAQKNSLQNKYKLLINKSINLNERSTCPRCISLNVYKHDIKKRVIIDLKFMSAGIKKWIVQYNIHRFRCQDCGKIFFNSSETKQIPRSKFGTDLKRWVIFQHIACRIPMNKIQTTFNSVFNLSISEATLYSFKHYFANKYKTVYNNLLRKLINGNLIHTDETRISIRGIESKGYVWILTNLDTVVFLFKETREVGFLKNLLTNFNGVLISDFYAGYDNIQCKQQKCLIHLIRDFNDDLYKNPLDFEYKELVIKFGDLINRIVLTINKKGLKKRFLHKHERDVDTFYKWLKESQSSSTLRQKYYNRLIKNKEKLFHFLKEDGIPWNNNNAEHGIKHFAAYRKMVDGLFSVNQIDDYLILLSIYQTCRYRNINFLKFLRFGDSKLIE